ncbi:hypothetical protein KR054_011569 [Drosophila jambulina]|nr:hypothetical protein KR054_011569 [Drosophila jambulina]
MLLCRSECDKILENVKRGDPSVKLIDYRVVRDLDAIGYLGDYYALTLRYYDEEEKTLKEIKLFVKALPQASAELAKEAIFQKEAWLYETLLAEMQKYCSTKWSADCYFTRSDLLVLEDIKLKGYKAAERPELSEDNIQQLIKSMAAFHAASLIYEQRTQNNIGETFADHLLEITVASEIAWFTTGLAAVLAAVRSLPQYQRKKEQSFIDTQLLKIMEEIYEQAKPSKKYNNVLCHRDLWTGNIFFPQEKSASALLIDFQTCRYTPPASDLNFSLYMNLSSKNRRNMERKCIDLYHSFLVKNLRDFELEKLMIEKSELLESYEDYRLFGVVYRAVAATIVKVPPEFVTNDFKYVDRSGVILSYMAKDQEFRRYMEECCVDVMEMALARGNM